jgi:hypothetical protein
MDDYPIRSITADELPAFEEALALAFHASGIDEHLKDDELIAEPDRWFVATDGGRIVGTCSLQRSDPKAALISSEKISGSSHDAKCPPFSASLK